MKYPLSIYCFGLAMVSYLAPASMAATGRPWVIQRMNSGLCTIRMPQDLRYPGNETGLRKDDLAAFAGTDPVSYVMTQRYLGTTGSIPNALSVGGFIGPSALVEKWNDCAFTQAFAARINAKLFNPPSDQLGCSSVHYSYLFTPRLPDSVGVRISHFSGLIENALSQEIMKLEDTADPKCPIRAKSSDRAGRYDLNFCFTQIQAGRVRADVGLNEPGKEIPAEDQRIYCVGGADFAQYVKRLHSRHAVTPAPSPTPAPIPAPTPSPSPSPTPDLP